MARHTTHPGRPTTKYKVLDHPFNRQHFPELVGKTLDYAPRFAKVDVIAPAEPKRTSDLRVVHNKLLGGWYIVRGAAQTPIGGRFDSEALAEQHLQMRKNNATAIAIDKHNRGLHEPRAQRVRGGLFAFAAPW